MSSPAFVDLFVEDRAHEALLRPVIDRAAAEQGMDVVVRVRSARGGHGRAILEFQLYQTLVEAAAAQWTPADIVVVGIDGNCTTVPRKRAEIRTAARPSFLERLVIACPDPHVERWYLADPTSFERVVGHRPAVGRRKCERDHYKRLLAGAVIEAGHPPTLGGMEFAREIAQAMDWYRAGRNDRSFKAFIDELRQALRGLDAGAAGSGA